MNASVATMNQISIAVNLDPYLSLKGLARYSSLSIRKLREYLSLALNALPHYRIGGKILVRRSEFDAWIAQYRRVGSQDILKIADELIKSVA
jgi:excisionase family DNA binding protein